MGEMMNDANKGGGFKQTQISYWWPPFFNDHIFFGFSDRPTYHMGGHVSRYIPMNGWFLHDLSVVLTIFFVVKHP